MIKEKKCKYMYTEVTGCGSELLSRGDVNRNPKQHLNDPKQGHEIPPPKKE